MNRGIVLARLFTLSVMVCCGTTTFTQNDMPPLIDSFVFQIDSFQHNISLANYTHVLLDPNNAYHLEDVRQPEVLQQFYPLIDYSDNQFSNIENPWGHVAVQNKLADHIHWSVSFYSYADSILAYVIRENGNVEAYKVGIHVPVEDTRTGSVISQAVFDTKPTIFIPLEQDEQIEIFFKIYPTPYCNCQLEPQIRSMEYNYQRQYTLAGYYTKAFLYMGAIWMFCLYNLFVFIFYKEKAYLFLSLYAFVFLLPTDLMSLVFLIKNWLPNVTELIHLKTALLNPLAFIAASCFARSYLDSKMNYPRTHRLFGIILVMGFTYMVISILIFIAQQYLTVNLVFYRFLVALIVAIFGGIILVFIAFDLAKHKDSTIHFLLGSLLILLLFYFFELSLMTFGGIELLKQIRKPIFPLLLTDMGILAQIAILTLGLGYRSREIAQEKEILEEKDQLKSRFFTNISHEFRTPLTLVMSPIEQLLEETSNTKHRELLELAHRNASRQLELINDILDLSKLEAGKLYLHINELDLVALLNGIVNSYASLAEQKNIQLEINTPPEPLSVFLDEEKFETICYNLLSNAFKFTPAGGNISITLRAEIKAVVITFTDTGQGIPAEQLPKIFDRFFYHNTETPTAQDSSGIGLALVKELVTAHHGTITVESGVHYGTTFHLRFPRGRNYWSEHEIQTSAKTKKQLGVVKKVLREILPVSEYKPSSFIENAKKPHILLVEDNQDMRLFIRQRLESSYRISEAINGEEGMQKAFDQMPDLIISDVMMPKINGYEVCQTLKTDIRTSHIPVILLTAKAAQAEKLEGLETGADAYLTKPFDAKELLVLVKNLIRLRQELRQRFSEAIFLKPEEVETNSLDKAFLEKALAVVEQHIDNENFSVGQMAQEMNMGATTLNGKLRALLDQSTNDFIQSVRLQRAADLLRQQAGTVSDIAFQTGFRSTAYFVKKFKDQFGETPGNFMKKHQSNL